MLKLCKRVLRKVSFDHFLFQKELIKSIKWINKAEAKILKNWCLKNYSTQYGEMIHETFEAI